MARKKAEAARAAEEPAVQCVVLEKFRDRETQAVRHRGDMLMLTEERFAELTAGRQWVAKVEPPSSAAPEGEAAE